MLSRKVQIETLIRKAKEQMSLIESEYNISLSQKSVSDKLKIEIKMMCENLRSALDYLAHDIRETYCPSARRTIFYFPIFSDLNVFRLKMSEWYPGLETASQDLWKYLESIQPYQGESTVWLKYFNQLNNENKHEALVEQIKSETERVHVKTQYGEISWRPDSVKFGKGVSTFGRPIDPATQMPVPDAGLKVERIVWVDFHFEDIPISALLLLRNSLNGVEKITSEIRKWL